MSGNHRESVLNAKILATHFRKLCENFSPPYSEESIWMNRQKLESNNSMLHFLTQLGRLIKEEKVDATTFKNSIKTMKCFDIIQIEVLWYLEVSKIMDLAESIQFVEQNKHEKIIEKISQQMYKNILEQKTNPSQLRKEMLIDCIKAVFKFAEEGLDTRDIKASVYQTMLNLIMLNLKQFYKCEENFDEKNLELLQLEEFFNGAKLDRNTVKLFFTQIIKSLLEGPFQTIKVIFKKQEKVKSHVQKNKILTFLNVMSKYCDHTELIMLLETILLDTSKGIDWDHMFCLITFLGVCTKDGWNSLRKIAYSIIKVSLENSNAKLLSYAFLIARQGCFEKSNTSFPSYLQWFSSTFSADSGKLINSKEKSVFFFNFLSDLVPYDQIYYSKVHINRVPWVPPDCHSLSNEYVALVKTHLCDLNVSAELGICENTTNKSAAAFDVENVLKHFERTNEILSSVFQASMFCRDYFDKKFLPELMSKFEGKKSARHKVIMKLHSCGKIPNSLLKMYKNFEKKK